MKEFKYQKAMMAATAFAASFPYNAIAEQNKVIDQGKPNILCITCEDISSRLGCFGDPVALTPNLDNFSRNAIRCTNMFTTVGVSAPSRSALITGMYPSTICTNNMRTGGKSRPEGIPPYQAVLPSGVRCYTEYMRQAGYYCTNNSKCDYQFGKPMTAWDESSKQAHWKNRPEGMPFFAIFNLEITHESQVWKGHKRPVLVDPDDIIVPPYFPDDPIIRKDMAVLYSNIKMMDEQFQELVDEVKDAGLLDNTIIIWYSDNGGPLPREKRSLYDTGTKVPFMISFPDGYRAGEIDDRLHMFPDIPATILSVAGICPPEYMQGRAFFGKFEDPDERKYVYGARTRMDESVDKQGAVRDVRYRYIRNYNLERSNYGTVQFRLQMPMMRRMLELLEKDSLDAAQYKWFDPDRPAEEFYDLEKDPYELNNLIDDPHYKKHIRRLKSEYERWINDECPRWNMTELEALETMWPGLQQPVVQTPEIIKTSEGITLACETDGVSYAYQINGQGLDPKHWFIYKGPILLERGDELTVCAVRAGMKNSRKITYVYE